MQRVIVLAFVWGWSFLFIKVAVEGFPPFTVAAIRMALGCLALLAIARVAGTGPLPRDADFWRAVAFTGVVGTAVPFTLLAWGEERITSALAAVAQATTVLFTALFAALLLGERLRRIQAVGLVVGLVGVAVAAGVGGGDLTSQSAAGVLAATAAGAAYGVAFVVAQRRLMHVDPMLAATGQLLAGTLALVPFAVGAVLTTGIDPTPSRVGSLVVLGVVNTGLAYWLNYGAIAKVGATGASLVTYLVPPVAIVAGWLVLDEPVGWRLWVGLVLIVGGVAAVRRPARQAAVPAATQG